MCNVGLWWSCEKGWEGSECCWGLSTSLPQDFIDLAPSGHGEDQEVVAAADVCLFGLNIIMPLMSRDLLKLPSLCSQYFKMVTFIAEIYPSKVCMLPEELMKVSCQGLPLGSHFLILFDRFRLFTLLRDFLSGFTASSP